MKQVLETNGYSVGHFSQYEAETCCVILEESRKIFGPQCHLEGCSCGRMENCVYSWNAGLLKRFLALGGCPEHHNHNEEEMWFADACHAPTSPGDFEAIWDVLVEYRLVDLGEMSKHDIFDEFMHSIVFWKASVIARFKFLLRRDQAVLPGLRRLLAVIEAYESVD